MKLATSTSDFASRGYSQAEALEYISQAGFKYADYNFHSDYANKTGVFGDDFEAHVDNINRKAQEVGIKLIQAHSPMGAPLAEDNTEFVKNTAKCIEACGKWGIENIVIHSGYTRNISKEETIERNKEFYKTLLPVAEKYEVNILTENFDKMCIEDMYWIDNGRDLLELIEAVDHPLFHAVWDTGHANMHQTPQDECLRLLGKHVYALHVQDNFGENDDHLPPLFGTMNLDSLMHGLKDIDYKGYFTFEAKDLFGAAAKRRPFAGDDRLLKPSTGLRIEAEKFLYEIGRHILTAYGCYEEYEI